MAEAGPELVTDRRADDARALRHLSWLIVAGLVCTIVIVLVLIFAALQAVAAIDAAARAREITQVSRALSALPDGLDTAGLADLGHTLDLTAAHLARFDAVGPNELSVPAGGADVVAWTPHLFGATTFAIVAPVRILMGAIFIGIVGLIGFRVVAVGRGLDRRRRAAAQLALTDGLTGLGNRLAFDAALRARLDAAAAGAPGCVLVLADLDAFKRVNDTLGHAAGDVVLRRVAGVLCDVAAPGDHVARIGGDEFALITSGADLDRMLERIQWGLAAPMLHDGRSLNIGASLGVARSDDFPGALSRLTQAADAALYRAKRNGGHCAELAVPAVVPTRRYAA